jgi:hypothetical protein
MVTRRADDESNPAASTAAQPKRTLEELQNIFLSPPKFVVGTTASEAAYRVMVGKGFQPWSIKDILEKYRLAGKRGMYPTLGVSDPRAAKKAERQALHRAVLGGVLQVSLRLIRI